ncbi:unnamed protein product [Thelazia callipaeda]|uniref:CHAP domain-containing protein n=1 Tax=Thelazia callipaeda TaxID=103827 RepID=A0A0N5CJ58_THECL|nr:unnamed protein product [Thelazia callipaeda]
MLLHGRGISQKREIWRRWLIRASCQRDPRLPFCGNGFLTQCDGSKRNEIEAAQCRAYFRDCSQYIQNTNPLYAIAKAYNSQIGINPWQFNVDGIPYYPVNKDRGVGAGQLFIIPYGTQGGGYQGHLGVRDYWSQYEEAGANWYDGLYGYEGGWSAPLVQHLGVQGGGGSRTAVPLHGPDYGKIRVDTGYGVDTYYTGNHLVGVDWKGGQVNDHLNIDIPLADVGYDFGRAVAFPSVDTFTSKFIQQ